MCGSTGLNLRVERDNFSSTSVGVGWGGTVVSLTLDGRKRADIEFEKMT